MPEKVDKDKTWQWLSKSDLNIGTKTLLCAAHEQAIRKNYVKHLIDKTSENPSVQIKREKKVKLCNILVNGCEKLAQKEYKRRNDNVAKKVH